MGLFKQMKDLKNTVHEAPGMVAQAQELQAQAQQMQMAQQQAAQAAFQQSQAGAAPGAPTAAPTGPDFEDISGISLEKYAEISKGLAAYNYDQTKGPELAAAQGFDAASWQAAVDGWNARMKTNPAVGKRFNALYTGRA